MKHLPACIALMACASLNTAAAVLQVGPDKEIRTVAEAAMRTEPGDTVLIDQGEYRNDYAVWRTADLTIRGLGSGAHFSSRGRIPNGKAIWITAGKGIVIENIELSGARVNAGNGAGIRQESGTLTLRNTYFHDNQFGIMSSNKDDVELTIEDSRFERHRRDNGIAHSIYAGSIARFTLTGTFVTDTAGGHHVKTRARENTIVYNRLADGPGLETSRIIDLPNCGLSIVMGNELFQKRKTRNISVIGYGPEKCTDRSVREKQLFVVNNTLVNESFNGVFVRNHADGEVMLHNNLLLGPGRFLSGGGKAANNVRMALTQRRPGSWLPYESGGIIDAAINVSGPDDLPLVPQKEFRTSAGTVDRPVLGTLDIGAREIPGN